MFRIIFSTENPLETLHKLKNEYSVKTANEYLEYLDVRDTLKEIAQAEADAERKEKEQQQKAAAKR